MRRRQRRRRNGNYTSSYMRNNRTQRRNNKVISVRRRPRRNVPRRVPTLGYAAGGTSTTFRSFLGDLKLPKNESTLNTCYKLTLQNALSKANSFLKIIPTIYTNYQVQHITFRVISLLGSNYGGVHAALVLDDSMGYPACSAMDYADVVSRGGSTTSKLYTDLAIDWVPTDPADVSYKDVTDNIAQIMYAVVLPGILDKNNDTLIGKLVADIRCVARTINPAVPPAEVCRLLGIDQENGTCIDAEEASA